MIQKLSNSIIATSSVLLAFLLAGCSNILTTVDDQQISNQDYVEIQRLYARFAHAIDSGDAEAYVETWTSDGEFTGGKGPGMADADRTPISGYKELRAMGERSGIGFRHFYTNIVVDKTPTGATANAYMLLLFSRPSPPIIIETAIYDDVLVKTEQGWKFKKRTVWRDDDDITPYKFNPLPPNFPELPGPSK